MSDNTEINILFKVYKELDITSDDYGNVGIKGIRDSAEVLNSGYVYIFRELSQNEGNDDGTRTRIYFKMNLADGQSTSLPEKFFNKYSKFFFAYSKIELTDNRVESIRNNLDSFLTDKNSHHLHQTGEYKYNIPSRVNFVPITPRDRDYSYTQTRHEPRQDVEFPEDSEYNTIIYLHDWITYLEDMTNDYIEKLNSYYEVLNQTKDVSGEDYSVYALYSFTKTIHEVASSKNKYYNNLKEGAIIHGSKGMREPRPITECLSELESIIAPKKEECRIAAEKIVNLYIEPLRRIHSSLIDYSFGEENEIDFAESLVGKSLQNNANFISEDKSEAFGLSVVKQTLVNNAAKFEEISDLSSLTPEEILQQSGEGDWFTYSFVLGNVKRIVTETPLILDSFLQNIPELTRIDTIVMYDYIRNGRYKELKGIGKIVSTDASRVRSFCRTRNIPFDGPDQALNQWKKTMENIYPDATVEFQVIDNVKTGVVLEEKFLEIEVALEPKLSTKFLAAGSEALSNLGNVMDGFNILYQVSAFKELKDTEEYLIAYASILSSLSGLCSVLIETSINKSISRAGSSSLIKISGGRVAGCVGILFTGIETGVSAVYRFSNDDGDAGAAYVASTIAAGAYIVLAFAGVTGAPLLICLAISILAQFLATYLTDDDIDVFLKYCLWGRNYNEIPEEHPAWWPSVEELASPNNAEQAIIMSESQEELFYNYDDHTPQNPLSFQHSSSGVDNLDYQLMALNTIIKRPPYQLIRRPDDHFEFAFVYDNTMHLQLVDIHDILHIDSIEIILTHESREIFKKTYTPWDNPGNFMNGLENVDIEQDLQKVDTFRVFFLYNKRELDRRIRSELRINNESYTTFNDYVPPYYHSNMHDLNPRRLYRRYRTLYDVKAECNIRYTSPLRRGVKIVKES